MTEGERDSGTLAGVWSRRPLLLVLCLALSGCAGVEATAPPGPLSETSVPAPSPTALATDTPRPPSISGPCTNDAEFLADESLPDGTVVAPGEPLDKRWRVRNSGSCDWGPGYTLARIDGPDMGAPQASGLFPARAGVEAIVQIALTAPGAPGEYTTTWELRDASGQPFGDSLFVTIAVTE